MAEAAIATIGFIGLGVMGEPICANMARRRKAQNRQQGGERIIGFDLSPAARWSDSPLMVSWPWRAWRSSRNKPI